jgi:hypothetical protein
MLLIRRSWSTWLRFETRDSWYASTGGGIVAGGTVNDLVPPTCANDVSCVPAIAWSSTIMDNGVVSAGSQKNGIL